jgi:hypothetical protein
MLFITLIAAINAKRVSDLRGRTDPPLPHVQSFRTHVTMTEFVIFKLDVGLAGETHGYEVSTKCARYSRG